MQNTPQTYRGSAAPGVNFPEHSYESHLGGGHCQPGGYQPYPNQAYHPRPHHYGNHHPMQQSMPYRHHGGGAYAPNQNQYGPGMNQDVYRNHHPGYAGNNRSIPPKPWTENNNSGELMPPYGQASPHSQMMNNPPQLPVNTMRSPTHAPSNMVPSPQGQQHYRTMQSPAHSPHSWSQAQIPSPGMMHSSRTSPLPTHVRSPGHSQPFSPPSAHSMNLQPHLSPQENGQLQQPMGGPENHSPANPLHSLQKMVLLDQDPKMMMGMPNDSGEQFQNQCGPQNYLPPDQCAPSSKDSQYSTYYNIDENRFESKPNASNEDPVYAAMQVTNCSYPISQPPGGIGTDPGLVRVGGNMNPNPAEAYHLNPNHPNSIHSQVSPMQQPPCSSNVPQNDCPVNSTECPPHAESAPVFTDQTKAAVSTNSELALESKADLNCLPQVSDPETASIAQESSFDAAGTPKSSSMPPESSSQDSSVATPPISYQEETGPVETSDQSDSVNPSTSVPSSESQDCDNSKASCDSKSLNCEESKETGTEAMTEQQIPDEVNDEASSSHADDSISKEESPKSQQPTEIEAEFIEKNPVKVVIHRIRKNDADDTWHVPDIATKKIKLEENAEDCGDVNNSTPPQIIMLAQEVNSKLPESSNSSSTNFDLKSDQVSEASSTLKVEGKAVSDQGADRKKTGRPTGSRSSRKPNAAGRGKPRGKRGSRKQKNDKFKTPEPVSKVKKASKPFNGPYVRVTGSKGNPSSISVVNVAQKEDEKVNKVPPKRTPSASANRIKSKTVGHLSTLSPTYDAFNRDKSWVCVFCQKGSHHGGLGDLYGPYYIKGSSEHKVPCPGPGVPGPSGCRGKRRKSETEETKAAKRSKQSSAHSTPAKRGNDKVGEPELMKEVWIHEDCAVWCQSITMMGDEVRGLEEAVVEAYENKCSHCSNPGATLGCWGKSCKEMYHYACAKANGCQLDIEKFSVLCRKHQKKSRDSK